MLKRVMIIGSLVMSLVSMVRTTVEAQSIGGFLLIGINSVKVESILKQLANANITQPAYEVVMFLQEVSVMCTNPSGDTALANNGRPFQLDNVAVSNTQTIDSSQITKNGRFLSDIVFSDDDLRAALAAARGSGCNKNWTADKIVVNAMQVFGTLFSCKDGGDPAAPRATGCAIADALGKQCDAPSGQDLFNTTFDYDCVTICQGASDCPQPPVELP
jgi:hypothetical protein